MRPYPWPSEDLSRAGISRRHAEYWRLTEQRGGLTMETVDLDFKNIQERGCPCALRPNRLPGPLAGVAMHAKEGNDEY